MGVTCVHMDSDSMGSHGVSPSLGSGYYEKVDGVDCDKDILEQCRESAKGEGDGRVSKKDAEAIFEKVKDGGKVTGAERWSLTYCLTAVKWTDAGQNWIVKAMEEFEEKDGKEDGGDDKKDKKKEEKEEDDDKDDDKKKKKH